MHMPKTELSIELDAEVAEGALEAAKSGDVSLSEWLNAAAERALAAELALTGVDELEEELEEELTDLPPEVEAEYGDSFLATP